MFRSAATVPAYHQLAAGHLSTEKQFNGVIQISFFPRNLCRETNLNPALLRVLLIIFVEIHKQKLPYKDAKNCCDKRSIEIRVLKPNFVCNMPFSVQ